MFRILHDTTIDFIRLWKPAAIVIALFILPSIVMIPIRGFNYSIEFTGGTLLQVEFKEAVDVAKVRSALADAGVPGVELSTFGSPSELAIRAQDPEAVSAQAAGAETVGRQVRAGLNAAYGEGSYTVLREEAVGPKVGGELRRQAVVALVIAFALTLVYLAWRFEWRVSLAAVLATVHDIFATLAFMQYLNLEVSLFVVGGILTVIGYSMNDKVVVFDRVRENLRDRKSGSLYDVLNRSVNETLPRTIMTGSTTLGCLLALLIFGGDVIRPFAWVLSFGIVIGTFSSIFIAAPVLLAIEKRWPRPASEKGAASHRVRKTGEPSAPKREKPEPVATR